MAEITGGITRRDFIDWAGKAAIGSAAALAADFQAVPRVCAQGAKRPNIVLVMTDDQGYGDLGCHGNTVIRTPNLDAFAKESVEMTRFYVSPVCAPTRACLMTGRYYYRTGVVDTYLGRAMMRPDEVTIAEMLRDAGYATGIFGKWHLGDNYPLRPSEQGFGESLVHNGGGIGQPSDPPGNMYFDPILKHNNVDKKYSGYCTDIFTDGAIGFIRQNRDKPFFVYLATNAPHTPLQISDEYMQPYLSKGLNEETARIYGMVTNIDDNFGRLLAVIRSLGIGDNTIVIFLTDNGPQLSANQDDRFNAGLRGRKGGVYENGIRVPFFIRWPEKLRAGTKVSAIGSHIDMVPTMLDACGLSQPEDITIDGVDLMPVLTGPDTYWPDRTLYAQWHRGDEGILYRQVAAVSQRYKLVQPRNFEQDIDMDRNVRDALENLELYDLQNDPAESQNIAGQHPTIVREMLAGYERWFADVSARGFAPPRIQVGTPHENPVILTRQDWRGPAAGWGERDLGYWEILVTETGTYDIKLRFAPLDTPAEAHFRFGRIHLSAPVAVKSGTFTFPSVKLEAEPGRLEAWIRQKNESVGVNYVDVLRK
ncbi:MAG: arylsulfatase [Candidatus Latescibacteria bacterium]|nr:arylsulfatase [Candidatus Latescibacterota bacterium]